jgi:hypothetical protein
LFYHIFFNNSMVAGFTSLGIGSPLSYKFWRQTLYALSVLHLHVGVNFLHRICLFVEKMTGVFFIVATMGG